MLPKFGANTLYNRHGALNVPPLSASLRQAIASQNITRTQSQPQPPLNKGKGRAVVEDSWSVPNSRANVMIVPEDNAGRAIGACMDSSGHAAVAEQAYGGTTGDCEVIDANSTDMALLSSSVRANTTAARAKLPGNKRRRSSTVDRDGPSTRPAPKKRAELSSSSPMPSSPGAALPRRKVTPRLRARAVPEEGVEPQQSWAEANFFNMRKQQ